MQHALTCSETRYTMTPQLVQWSTQSQQNLCATRLPTHLAAGARALVTEHDFAASQPATPYLGPTVLVDVDHTMSVMRDESFGPVIGIVKVRSDDEAVALMNDSQYGLTASIWTNDIEVATALGNRIETGTVYMNRCDYVDPHLVWTGVKNTGRGIALSSRGFDPYVRLKSFHLREIGRDNS